MESSIKNKSKKIIIINIILYVIVGVLFLLAVFGIILKFSSNKTALFNTRFDVVLTDSMSEKNPEYADFLEGHDDQIQAMDIVISKTDINEETLNVYDIVLFNNKELGATDMHRIVGKTLKTVDEITVSNAFRKEIGSVNGICFGGSSGGIVTNVISATKITLVTFSSEKDERPHFAFSHSSAFYEADVSYQEADGGFYTTYVVDIGTTSPRKLVVAHQCVYDYSSEIISSCIIESYYGTIDLKIDNLVAKDDGFFGEFNKTYYYEIRGDKSNTSDGTKFTIEDIYSKVVGTIPKLGFVVRYLSSVPGMVMLIGMGVIIIVYDVVSAHLNNKKKVIEGGDELPKDDGKEKKNE